MRDRISRQVSVFTSVHVCGAKARQLEVDRWSVPRAPKQPRTSSRPEGEGPSPVAPRSQHGRDRKPRALALVNRLAVMVTPTDYLESLS